MASLALPVPLNLCLLHNCIILIHASKKSSVSMWYIKINQQAIFSGEITWNQQSIDSRNYMVFLRLTALFHQGSAKSG